MEDFVTLTTTEHPSLTARAVAAIRALELGRPTSQRIVTDRFAPVFLSRGDRLALHTARRTGFLLGRLRLDDGVTSILCRHRFLDERLLAALPDVRQVLVLGAGYDARAYRFASAIGPRTVFEVDLPALSRRKAGIVAARPGLFARGRAVRVETDFRSRAWHDGLVAAGFDPGAPTFVAWEGVAMYLSRQAVSATLDELRGLCGAGSVLAMDLVRSFSGWRPRALALRAATQPFRLIGEPVRFGLDAVDAGDFLAGHGWQVDQLLEAPAMTRRLATAGRRCQPGLYVLSAVAS